MSINSYSSNAKWILPIIKTIDIWEVPTKQVDYWKRKAEARSGSLPKGQKWYLLNKLFRLRPSEIAELEGIKGSSSVRQLITRVSDQLKCGEINLIDCTPEEAQAAKTRLKFQLKKRREKRASK